MPKSTKNKRTTQKTLKPKRTRTRTPNNKTTTNFHVSEALCESNVYAYLLQDATGSFVIVLNFGDKPVSLSAYPNNW
jgi:hypothetical protein